MKRIDLPLDVKLNLIIILPQGIKEHERSISHQNSFEAFLMYSNASDIESRLNSGKRYEVERKSCFRMIN